MLRIADVGKSFFGFVALNRMNLSVELGEMRALIGPNGAGKTTLLNVISGYFPPDSGDVQYKDRSIVGIPPHRLYHEGIARSFQITSVFPRYSVFQNVQLALMSRHGRCRNLMARVKGVMRDEVYQLLEFVKMDHRANDLAGQLNAGDGKRLEFAIGLAAEPELMLLDEPTAGMGESEKAMVIDIIRRMNREREVTILFTEHDMDVVFDMAQKITVMHEGSFFAEGLPDEMRSDKGVQEIYFGEATDAEC